ncbi:MAG: cupin domain-containing protein [Canibacter sp.]
MTDTALPARHNARVSVPELEVTLEAVPDTDTVSGAPVQGAQELGAFAGSDFGVWELRDGVVTDTEVEEISVIVSGSATIEFLAGPQQGDTITVRAGDVLRLAEGAKTRWSVEDHIRKVYFIEN